MDSTGTTTTTAGTSTQPARGVGKLLAKRLRRRREPSLSGIQRHSTFAGDLGDPTAVDVGALDVDDDEEEAYDSDPELSSAGPSRPKVVPSAHPSHIGYLTTSSPIVHATHQPASRSDPSLSWESDITARSPAGSRPPSNSSKSDLNGPDSDRPSRSRTRQVAAANATPSISVSPAGRIRDIFSKRPVTSGPGQSRSHADPDTGSPSRLSRTAHVLRSRRSSVDRSRSRPRSSHSNLSATNRPSTPPVPTSATEPAPETGLPSAPISAAVDTPHGVSKSAASPPRQTASTPQNVNPHRRSRAGSASLVPSKLSATTLPPPTPNPDARPGTSSGAPTSSGFFSSIVSVAQNAATTISTTIIPNPASRPQTAAVDNLGIQGGGPSMVESPPRMDKDSAVRTLGSGDLSLSQLGLADPTSSEAVTPVAARFHDGAESSVRPRSEPVDSLPAAPPSDPGSEDITAVTRARTFHDPSASSVAFNDLSSPTGSVCEEKPNNGLGRSGSVKSALGRRGRNRGSSNTTGVSSQASASAVNLTTPFPPGTASSSGPKLTGFAIASKKRNRDFHSFFKSVPDDDYLIEDYSCALQREILAHGRLYVSEGHLCFSSNIFGWVTTLVMSFGEIVSVEKRSTALLFKNGLMITTLHAKHVFASFTSRDATYDLIVNIWKLGHPSLQSSLNGIRLEGTGGDKTEKIDAPATLAEQEEEEEEEEEAGGSGTEEDSEEEDVYDEDDDDEHILPDTTQLTDASMIEAAEPDKAISRKPSGTTNPAGATPEQPSGEVFPTTSGAAADFPGPATHAPTDCGDSATHFDRLVADEIVPAPLGQVYNKLFGPESVTWMTKWLQVDQKCTEFQMEDKKGLTQENKTRTFSYIKPLNGSFGPRSTKCIVTETLDQLDLEKAVSISCSTLTPDVPSGNVFSTKTKYCLTWAENNSTRFQASCTVEWTGKSWIKGPIEKGCNDGQIQYCKELIATLKSAVARPRSGTGNGGAKTGKGRKKAGRKAPQSPVGSSDGQGSVSQRSVVKASNWGPFEPVRPLLEPVTDLFKPLLSANVFYGLLVGLLIAWWFGFGSTSRSVRPLEGGAGGAGGDMAGFGLAGYPDRIAAYEEMWRREESDLWEWLEERIGHDRIAGELAGGSYRGAGPSGALKRMNLGDAKTWEDRLRQEKVDGRELEEAIRVTEERLRVLKDVVGRKGAE